MNVFWLFGRTFSDEPFQTKKKKVTLYTWMSSSIYQPNISDMVSKYTVVDFKWTVWSIILLYYSIYFIIKYCCWIATFYTIFFFNFLIILLYVNQYSSSAPVAVLLKNANAIKYGVCLFLQMIISNQCGEKKICHKNENLQMWVLFFLNINIFKICHLKQGVRQMHNFIMFEKKLQ